MIGDVIMVDKKNLKNDDVYDKIVDNEEKKVDPSNPCDESSPDYPWVPCGLNKDDSKDNK